MPIDHSCSLDAKSRSLLSKFDNLCWIQGLIVGGKTRPSEGRVNGNRIPGDLVAIWVFFDFTFINVIENCWKTRV